MLISLCSVEVTLKRFQGMHVGMSSPIACKADYKLGLALIKAHWEHALESVACENAARL
jgi:hypothetical protein